MKQPKIRYGVPADLAKAIQDAAPGGENALFRWYLRFTCQQIQEWLANDRLTVATMNPAQRRALKAAEKWLRDSLE